MWCKAEQAKLTLREIQEKEFGSGADLQAYFIEDRASRLQSEVDLAQAASYAQASSAVAYLEYS